MNDLSDETGDAHLGGADAVVVAELAALLAQDHGLNVAGHLALALTLGCKFGGGRRLGQQRHHARRLQLHPVPASGLRNQNRRRRGRCRRPRQYPPLRVRNVRVVLDFPVAIYWQTI